MEYWNNAVLEYWSSNLFIIPLLHHSNSFDLVRAVETTDEAARVELAHDSVVDQLLGLHLINIGISGAQEPVDIAHALQRGGGIFVQAFQDILVAFFSQSRIGNFQTRLDRIEHDRLILRAQHKCDALDDRLQNILQRFRLLAREGTVHDDARADERQGSLVKL